MSVAIETTADIINNTMVHLTTTIEGTEIETTSCALALGNTCYILTYGIATGINSLDQCEYIVYNHADNTESFSLSLIENESDKTLLMDEAFNTDIGDMMFMEERSYSWDNKESGETEIDVWALMQPLSGYHADLNLSDFSGFLTDGISEDVSKYFTFEVSPFDYTVLEELGSETGYQYFSSMCPALNIKVIADKALNEEYGDKAESIIYEYLAAIGIEYKGDSVSFTYIPAINELVYE